MLNDDSSAAQSTCKPLFVVADEPLLIFQSVQAAEIALEAIDVEDHVYGPAFGPGGEPYLIRSQDNRVIIEPTEEATRAEELRALLSAYLERCGSPADTTASLAELVAMTCAREFGL